MHALGYTLVKKTTNAKYVGSHFLKAVPCQHIIGYVATIVYVPDTIIKQISNLFFDFVWPSGKHHVKKSVLIQEIESGGLKMPDASMLKAVKLGWLKRLCTKQSYTFLHHQLLVKMTFIHS